jgi:hypothetical protein
LRAANVQTFAGFSQQMFKHYAGRVRHAEEAESDLGPHEAGAASYTQSACWSVYHRLPQAADDPGLVVAGVMPLWLEMGAFALNDYFDVEVDRKNNRTDRPIIRGDISGSALLPITFR